MPEKIKVKDVKDFIESTDIQFASGLNKRFFVSLHAGPYVERYLVEVAGEKKGFVKLGDAVRYFNGEEK